MAGGRSEREGRRQEESVAETGDRSEAGESARAASEKSEKR